MPKSGHTIYGVHRAIHEASNRAINTTLDRKVMHEGWAIGAIDAVEIAECDEVFERIHSTAIKLPIDTGESQLLQFWRVLVKGRNDQDVQSLISQRERQIQAEVVDIPSRIGD